MLLSPVKRKTTPQRLWENTRVTEILVIPSFVITLAIRLNQCSSLSNEGTPKPLELHPKRIMATVSQCNDTSAKLQLSGSRSRRLYLGIEEKKGISHSPGFGRLQRTRLWEWRVEIGFWICFGRFVSIYPLRVKEENHKKDMQQQGKTVLSWRVSLCYSSCPF